MLGGAFLVGRLGTPLAALGIFVLGKIVIDIAFHIREHRRTASLSHADTATLGADG